MMKIYIMIFILAMFSMLKAQDNTNDFGKIGLTVVVNENQEGLDAYQISKLKNKIEKITEANGMSSMDLDNSFVIYPNFSINDIQTGDAGMEKIVNVSSQVELVIVQPEIKKRFSSVTKFTKGYGKTKEIAITQAINNLSVNDPDINKFITDARTKILDYYQQNCSKIIAESDRAIKLNDYGKAFSLLISIPQESKDCYKDAEAKMIEAYKLKQNYDCEKSLQKANASAAQRNYYESLKELTNIDPESKCYKESKADYDKIMKENSDKITDDQRREFDLKMKKMDNANYLAKYRYLAIRDLAIAYYSSQPRFIYNNVIIRY